ncbi:MAG: LysR family transcriptional regulator [Bdellovibrionia bacterium]
MDLQHLSVFYEVARRGSFSGASKALRITQPSLSRTVQNLESSLNVKLFIRQARGVSLTEEGQRVFERCHRIFQECDAIERKTSEKRRRMRIAASENLSIHIFPKIFAHGTKTMDAASVDLFSGTAQEIVKAVLNDEADVGYCYHPTAAPGLSCVAVASVEFWLIVSPSLLRSKPSLKDLKNLALIGSFAKKYAGPNAAKNLLAEVGLSPGESIFQSNSHEAQVSMVEAGLGYSLVPWFIAQDRIVQGKLKRVPTSRVLKTPIFRIRKLDSPLTYHEDFEHLLRTEVVFSAK